MLNSGVNIVVWWPDWGDFLPFTLHFPPFLWWIFSCFHLACSGNKADFYLYAQMPGRYTLMGYLYISPPSLVLSLPLSVSLSLIFFFFSLPFPHVIEHILWSGQPIFACCK